MVDTFVAGSLSDRRRYRRWSAEAKRAICLETRAPGVSVAQVMEPTVDRDAELAQQTADHVHELRALPHQKVACAMQCQSCLLVGDRTAPCPLDKVNRQFTADRPNRLWVSDFTYVPTWAGMVYVAFVIDVFARRIVGWRASQTASAQFVLDALEQAVHMRRPTEPGLIHHSDRGVQGGLNRCRNSLMQEVAMTKRKRRSARSVREALRSPGRPPVGQREHRRMFWSAIAAGRS
jgi:transposase InsO family protein